MSGRCYRCGVRENTCVCDSIPSLNNKSLLVLLMHPKEFKKERLGTGRMTHAALKNSQMIMGVDFTIDQRVNALIEDSKNFCTVLWPGDNALEWTGEMSLRTQISEKRLVVFLLDGTWNCARKMYRLSQNLHSLPKISLNPTRPSAFSIKQQPDVRCLSTIEATQLLFETLEEAHLENREDWNSLVRPFLKMNAQQIEIASDPDRQGYRRGAYNPAATLQRAIEGTRARKLF